MAKKDFWFFSKQEKIDLIVSWITLSLAFAVVINPVFFNLTNLLVSLPIALVAVGTGFVFHELAHRQAARHYGFASEFRAWYPGLAFALLLAIVTGGRFIFAAPGATYYFGNNVTTKQNGIISVAGPIINIILGLILLSLSIFSQEVSITTILIYSAMINFWFALFNMIPVYPLDGSKVLAWNPAVWVAIIGISAVLVFMPGTLLSIFGIAF
jgi:Zn-dependent protease